MRSPRCPRVGQSRILANRREVGSTDALWRTMTPDGM